MLLSLHAANRVNERCHCQQGSGHRTLQWSWPACVNTVGNAIMTLCTHTCKHIHKHSAHITHDRRDDRWHSIATAVMIVCRLWLTRICRNSTCLYYIAFTMPILIRSGWALYYVGPNAECVWVERWVDCGSAWMSACMSCVPGEFSCLFSYSGSTSTSHTVVVISH